MIPVAQMALAAAPANPAVYGIALRTWAAAGRMDSVRSIATRWATIAPSDETPYREWGGAELGRENRAGARAAYLLGRSRLNRPDALAGELAQLAAAEGDYPAALEEWLLATRRYPGYLGSAVATLGQAPDAVHENLRGLCRRPPTSRLGGWRRSFVRTGVTPKAQSEFSLAHCLPTEFRPSPVFAACSTAFMNCEAARFRLDAAQAYSAGGDKGSARRMLGGLASDRNTPASISSDAAATLVRVLIGEGKLADAQKRLVDARAGFDPDDFDALRRELVTAWMRSGDLARADSAIAPDSSVEGLALGGRVRLYQGDISGAIERFKEAGPFTQDREEATQRTALLALLQPLERDSFPELGHALLLLEQGDTSGAAGALQQLTTGLPPERGAAELNLLAGRLLLRTGKASDAERLFRAAASPQAPGTAPAAELALAELLMSSQRPGEAVTILEHLILTYPQSALVPQARRQLDEARGAVPKT
jgi:tetratricopeptide (TPR) repeat protein